MGICPDTTNNTLMSGYFTIQVVVGIVPLAEMAGFIPFLLQLFALRLSTLLNSGHLASSKKSSMSPPLEIFKFLNVG